jgi:hypothetical protein
MSPIARAVMSLASRVAPPSRAGWADAMRAEFEALEGGPGSLAWALGCLASTSGWRLRAEAGFLFAVAAGWMIAHQAARTLGRAILEGSEGNTVWWWQTTQTMQAAVLFGLCFTLAALWPRRAWLVGAALPLVWLAGWPLIGFVLGLGDSLHRPLLIVDVDPPMPFIAWPFWTLGSQVWTGLVGAILGWGLGVAIRRRGRASPTP